MGGGGAVGGDGGRWGGGGLWEVGGGGAGRSALCRSGGRIGAPRFPSVLRGFCPDLLLPAPVLGSEGRGGDVGVSGGCVGGAWGHRRATVLWCRLRGAGGSPRYGGALGLLQTPPQRCHVVWRPQSCRRARGVGGERAASVEVRQKGVGGEGCGAHGAAGRGVGGCERQWVQRQEAPMGGGWGVPGAPWRCWGGTEGCSNLGSSTCVGLGGGEGLRGASW